jgi:hypothetical protein
VEADRREPGEERKRPQRASVEQRVVGDRLAICGSSALIHARLVVAGQPRPEVLAGVPQQRSASPW